MFMSAGIIIMAKEKTNLVYVTSAGKLPAQNLIPTKRKHEEKRKFVAITEKTG